MSAISLIITIGGMLLSAGIAWGITTHRIKNTEEKLTALAATYSKDHDLLVEIKTKLDLLLRGKLK